jgi:hypothetical protein
VRVQRFFFAAELRAVPTPEGKPRVTLRVCLPDRTVAADVAAKSLRRAQRAIREAETDNFVVLLQGRLGGGDLMRPACPRDQRMPHDFRVGEG